MRPYPSWESTRLYVKGERVVHDGRLYVAAESVTGTTPDPGTSLDHWPWVLLGREPI